jgi:type III secretion protein C
MPDARTTHYPSPHRRSGWRLSLCLLPLLCLLGGGVQAAIPDSWKSTAYAYEADEGTPLRSVLGDFASTFGVILDIDGSLDGSVSGKLRADNPQAFLDRLALEHRFQWFVYNNTLYVSPLDRQDSARLEISADAVPDLQQALTNIGLLDKRFGWGELPDEGVVLVSGPKRYVQLVSRFTRQRATEEEKQDIISFPLRYASAADRRIGYRGETLTIPGVASILRGLLESRSNNPLPLPGGGGASPMNALQGVQSMGENQLEQMLLSRIGQDSANRLPTSGKGGGKIRVEADVRNNAVLIYDGPKRRDLYQRVIRDLDVPRKLVEIDAIIVDIDRSQLAELASRWNAQSGDNIGGASLLAPGASSTLFIQDFGDFFAELRALEGRGVASVVANPSVLTLENQPAVIDFSRTEYLTAVGERVANIVPVTAGTSLQVVPHAIEAGEANLIQLVVDIEDGLIEASQAGQDTPSVRRGNVSTQAVVDEKRSLVIGGFHVEETGDNEQRVPLLGSIPFLGKLLFSSTRRETNRRERLFILTPRLIGDQIDPSRYLGRADRHRVDAALAQVEARRSGLRPIGRDEVAVALASLVEGQVPLGFSETAVPYVPETLCNTSAALALDPARAQWFAGDDYGIAVAVVRNTSAHRLRIDEAGCGGRRALAVSVWPRAWLEPGQEAEVFVAMRPPTANSLNAPRASLLETARRTDR